MSLDLSTLVTYKRSEFKGTDEQWLEAKAAAALVVNAGDEQIIYTAQAEIMAADDYPVTEDEVHAKNKKGGEGKTPYGDVEYADPGYQSDKKKRYPINTPEHIRAAWNYIHKAHNGGKYSSSKLAHIKSKIISAWKKHIDPKGPPSA